MRVINLTGQKDSFETEVISGDRRPIIRSFGLWSFDEVLCGDYVVVRSTKNGLVCHLVRFANPVSRGSDGNRFWRGEMIAIDLDEIEKHPILARALREKDR